VRTALREIPGDFGVREGEALGGLRLRLVRIEKDLLAGEVNAARRLVLSEQIARLAEHLAEEGADDRLAGALRAAAEALERGDEGAAARLRAAAEELARLEEKLKDPEWADRHLKELADRVRAAASADAGPPPSGLAAENLDDEGLVELAPHGAEAPAVPEWPAGVLYTARAGGVAPEEVERRYEAARAAALRELDGGRIPPGYRDLVRAYFQAVRPAERP
jgi:hypothetical protein